MKLECKPPKQPLKQSNMFHCLSVHCRSELGLLCIRKIAKEESTFAIKLTVSPAKSCIARPLGHLPLPGPAWLSTRFQTEKAKPHN